MDTRSEHVLRPVNARRRLSTARSQHVLAISHSSLVPRPKTGNGTQNGTCVRVARARGTVERMRSKLIQNSTLREQPSFGLD